MIGPTKLKAIRAEVQKSFKMPSRELFAWFNRQLENLGQESKANKVEMETFRLLRDALVNEAKRAASRRKVPSESGGSKR